MYCRNCGNKLDNNSSFCSNCGMKDEIKNFQSNIINSKKNKLTKILGICAGVSFGLVPIALISGIVLCFPDPLADENTSGLSFDLFGECAGILIVIGVVFVITIVILNIIKPNKRSI